MSYFVQTCKVFIAFALLMILCPAGSSPAPVTKPRVVHVFVALCDNQYQGIVPVSETLGNGDDPATNLYWGALYGVKTHFKRSADWTLIKSIDRPGGGILERCVFLHKSGTMFMVADAYQGREIKKATIDFLEAASGAEGGKLKLARGGEELVLSTGGSADLVAYIGHNGLMDFSLARYPEAAKAKPPDAIILACASKPYFKDAIKKAGARPLLWTTGLMAPEAYTLEAALQGFAGNESDEQIRARAASAYHKYQKCGIKAAERLLVTGW